jgi:hypothetical protein
MREAERKVAGTVEMLVEELAVALAWRQHLRLRLPNQNWSHLRYYPWRAR